MVLRFDSDDPNVTFEGVWTEVLRLYYGYKVGFRFEIIYSEVSPLFLFHFTEAVSVDEKRRIVESMSDIKAYLLDDPL